MGLELVAVRRGAEICSTGELRRRVEQDDLVEDGEIGVLFVNSDGDGAALYGDDPDELIAVLYDAIAQLRAISAPRNA